MAPKAGTYKIINNIFTDRVVDLADNDTSPGNPIIGYDWHGGDNQQWTLAAGSGPTIFSFSSLKVFATTDKIPAAKGSKIVVGPAQQFEINDYGQNTYRIKVVNANLYWRLPDGNEKSQIEVQPDGSGNDVWTFELAD